MTYQKETLEEEYQQLVGKLVDSRVKRLEPFIDKSSILLAYGEPSKRVVEKLDCDEKFVCHRDDSPIKCTGNFRRLDDLGELETSRADVLWYTGNVDLDTIKSELRELSSFLGPKSVLVAEVNVFSVVRSKDALLSIKDELARLGFHQSNVRVETGDGYLKRLFLTKAVRPISDFFVGLKDFILLEPYALIHVYTKCLAFVLYHVGAIPKSEYEEEMREKLYGDLLSDDLEDELDNSLGISFVASKIA